MNKPIPFGKYYLLERINVGGMAEVFRAKQFGVEGFERLVAVKRILPNIAEDKEFIEMFVDEAKISAQLTHANIAQVFDLGHEEGSYYIALEHIHGRDLRAVFDRNRSGGEPLPVPQACFVIMKVCEGLDYAHNKRDESGRELHLVHRDVSPQNVIVSHEGEVKLIDFGIAKAAGRGSQTQAGILKGKFGYMSPEQVRGLPVDRRSDVFSCGIVLYELLTGERLFVGESDFSTLEKVRNVEILPPSTYNRKIQPELERIVLRALSKDVEDRYQNAIDLHDELQAFVYTSGAFYSRKDLAGWMKNQWSKEIKEESAKLALYRDMEPPAAALASTSSPPRPGSGHMPEKRKTNPPPIPSEGRRKRSTGPTASLRAASSDGGQSSQVDKDLEWDDDELETSIYDEDSSLEDLAIEDLVVDDAHMISAVSMATPAMTPNAMGAESAAGGTTLDSAPLGPAGDGDTVVTSAPTGAEPDLSSLLSTSRGWDAPSSISSSSLSPSSSTETSSHEGETERLADGSNRTKTPGDLVPDPESVLELGLPRSSQGESEASGTGFRDAASVADRAVPGRSPDLLSPAMQPTTAPRSNLLYGLIAVSILITGGILAIVLSSVNSSKEGGRDDSQDSVPENQGGSGANGAGAPKPEKTETAAEAAGVANKETGLDLIVNPSGVKVSLDGGELLGRAPLQIRNLRPGEHFIEIEAPLGFFSKSETITVVQNRAERVQIVLDAMKITGKFSSTPVGAEVFLIADGTRRSLGAAPVEYNIDPRTHYDAVFEMAGYKSVSKPVEISSDAIVSVSASLIKVKIGNRRVGNSREGARAGLRHGTESNSNSHLPGSAATLPRPSPVKTEERPQPVVPRQPTPRPPSRVQPVSNASGTLMLSAKPPCKIFIDGRDTGSMTPQRRIKLSVGKHRITLLNNQFGISESFNVKIVADKATKALKDFTDQID